VLVILVLLGVVLIYSLLLSDVEDKVRLSLSLCVCVSVSVSVCVCVRACARVLCTASIN
jgi:hypothetical protein